MNKSLIIPGELTDLNTYIRIERGNRFAAAKLKKAETERVALLARAQKVGKIKKIVECVFTWYTKDARKDADNCSFATKFVMDGLVAAGCLVDDSRAYTGSFVHHFEVDKKQPRTEVDIVV